MTFLKPQCPSSTYLSKHRRQSTDIIQGNNMFRYNRQRAEIAERSPEVHRDNLRCLSVGMCICKDLSKQGPLANGAVGVWVCANIRNNKCAILHR